MEGALLPHWVGAVSIWATSPWLDAALAARLPFALLLGLTLIAVWYATFNLARNRAAQPLPFAFGGEANAIDYARAVADGALLAMIATLGLLQLGHETTPEMAQLAAVASFQWALSAACRRRLGARIGVLVALPCFAACGAPAMAVALGLGAAVIVRINSEGETRDLLPFLLVATALAALAAWPVHSWAWRMAPRLDWAQLGRLWIWFLWPAWALAAWTLWRWRKHLGHSHLLVPLLSLSVALLTSIVMGASDRALMLGLPGIAALAAFALPTLRRSTSSAIDWCSVTFFSASASVAWFYFVAAHTGMPARAADSVARLLRGFEPQLSVPVIATALLGTVAWLWLVRWRTSRHRAALWKSLVLPAGGVVLCWLLAMTLWLPAIDHARSYRPLMDRLLAVLPPNGCIAAPNAASSLVSALEYYTRRRVDASAQAADGHCASLVLVHRGRSAVVPPTGWDELASEQRPTERNEFTLVYRRRVSP